MNQNFQLPAVRRTLLSEFMLLITIIILLFSAIAGWYIFNSVNTAKEKEQLLSLSNLTKTKSRIINQYIEDHLTHITVLGIMPLTQQAMSELAKEFHNQGAHSVGYQQVMLKYDNFFKRHLLKVDYYDLFLIDLQGNIVYAIEHENYFATNLGTKSYADTGLAKVFKHSIDTLQVNNSTFKYYLPSKELSAFIGMPIIANGKILGVIALQFNTENFYNILSDLTGLGETGEIVVGQKINDQIMITAPLRHDSNAAFKRVVKIDEPYGMPIIDASQGKTGFGTFIDWRGEEVLAAWEYIPGLKWGIVIKIDTKEAFGYWRNILKDVSIYVGFGLLASYLLMFFFTRRITQSLRRLTQACFKFASGQEDVRINSTAKNEVGVLSAVFNHMIASVALSKAKLAVSQALNESNRKLDQELIKGQMMVAKLKHSEAELKASNKELEQFASIASHDLQEPLRKIQSFGQMLNKEVDLKDDAKNYLDRMLAASSRMSQLIDDLLSYSRVATRGNTFTNVALEEVINEALDMLEIRIKEIKAEITITGELPVINADPAQMRQLFQNLIGNSLKYAKENKKLHVNITAKQNKDNNNDLHCIVIEDNGIGFNPEYNERIFDMFQRLHGRNKYDGTGIGLAICKRIVNRHRGSIYASGEIGIGACFTICFRKNIQVNS